MPSPRSCLGSPAGVSPCGAKAPDGRGYPTRTSGIRAPPHSRHRGWTHVASGKDPAVTLNADLLRASFDLAVSRRPDLTERFYQTLFERYPSLRSLFQHTSTAAQAKMLAHALSALLEHLEDTWWLTGALHRLG